MASISSWATLRDQPAALRGYFSPEALTYLREHLTALDEKLAADKKKRDARQRKRDAAELGRQEVLSEREDLVYRLNAHAGRREGLRAEVRGGRGPRNATGRSWEGTLRLVDLTQLEAEALELPASDRARLAEKLLGSLETLSESENERLWLEEAERRDADLEEHPERGRPAEEVLRDARARRR